MAFLSRSGLSLCRRQCALASARFSISRSYATEAPAPPLLLRLRQDLKSAMQQKDKDRLAVLRGVLADITNASKASQTDGPKTDIQILSILRKRTAESKHAAHQFGEAGRLDLKEKEDSQIQVLDEYSASVQTVDEEEIRTRVGEVVTELSMADADSKKISKGLIMKKLLGPGGVFDGQPVEKSTVTKLVDVAIGDSTKA